MSASDNKSKRAEIVSAIVQQYYEEGRHDRSLLHIYRTKVVKLMPISKSTFWRYINLTNTRANIKKKVHDF